MGCSKRRFRDRIAADLAIATIQRRDKSTRPKTEKRAYRCPECKTWHITSRR